MGTTAITLPYGDPMTAIRALVETWIAPFLGAVRRIAGVILGPVVRGSVGLLLARSADDAERILAQLDRRNRRLAWMVYGPLVGWAAVVAATRPNREERLTATRVQAQKMLDWWESECERAGVDEELGAIVGTALCSILRSSVRYVEGAERGNLRARTQILLPSHIARGVTMVQALFAAMAGALVLGKTPEAHRIQRQPVEVVAERLLSDADSLSRWVTGILDGDG